MSAMGLGDSVDGTSGLGLLHRFTRAVASRGDKGQSVAEYVGLIVLVAAIVASLVVSGVGGQIGGGLQAAVCEITGSACGAGPGGDQSGSDDQSGNGSGSDPDNDDSAEAGRDHSGDGAYDPSLQDPDGTVEAGDSEAERDYEDALRELEEAQQDQASNEERAREAAQELARILADELGITDALDCVTEGDMGACAQTLVNSLLSLVGGAVGRLAARYGAPWKWDDAARLINNVRRHGDDLYDALTGLIDNRRRVERAREELADAERARDAQRQRPQDGAQERPPDEDPPACPTSYGSLPGTRAPHAAVSVSLATQSDYPGVGTIVSQNGVTIQIYSNDHAPPHAHVKGNGVEVRIGQNGRPLAGDPELSRLQQQVVDSNLRTIRGNIRAAMARFRDNGGC
ncbi:hypothetical protein [Streptomyces sp. NBC_01506]|uniref:hypothetical protein n=1 Tax=Streptomyces sp. NBC_01506 TaxID=2903887 RepID=UPI003862EB9A